LGHERFEEPTDLGPDDGQRCYAVLLALPQIEHHVATCLQVDNDGADVAGLTPVDLVELFQRGGSVQLDGSNELSRTMAYILVLLIFDVPLGVAG
jgi:hypothetical protein